MVDESIVAKLLIEQSLWGVIIIELQSGKISFSNEKANKLISVSGLTLQGHSINEFIPLDNEIVMNANFFRQDSFYGEIFLRKENESLFPFQVLTKTFSAGVECSLVILQDISPQKKMQRDLLIKHEGLKDIMKELIEKNEKLLELDKGRTKFLSLVAHELRTPLTTIVATSDAIYNKLYETPAEFDDLTKNLRLQSHQIVDLVNDILDLTKIHSGLLEFFIEEIDPCDVIEKQINIFSDMALQNSVKILFRRPEAPMICFADPVRLDQVISNLLSNAIKFNRHDGNVKIDILHKIENVEISVEDAGIGIAQNKFASIFNEFETLEDISKHHKGTGLGLPIVKLLIEAQGGTITLTSEIGKGTTFFVTLPVTKCLSPEVYRSRVETKGFILFDEGE